MSTNTNNEQRRFGWLPDKPDYRDHVYGAAGPQLQALPQSMDLRKLCPPVYDQGQLGSCTANAIGAAIQFDRLKQGLKDFTPSRLFIYYNERVIEHTVQSDAGAAIRDGIKSVAKQGDCPETEWPYDITKFAVKPPQACFTDAVQYKVVSYQRVSRNIQQMKGCLADRFPFVFGISVYENFPMDTKTGDIPMPGNAAATGEGHAMTIVGYDDARRVFLVRNSWGKVWGAQGYGTIPYDYLMDPGLSSDFWTIRVLQA